MKMSLLLSLLAVHAAIESAVAEDAVSGLFYFVIFCATATVASHFA